MPRERTWSIRQIARLAGTTSRTLRHYHAIGLLSPAEVGANGYRRYGERELLKLQRILLWRSLDLPLTRIAELEARQADPLAALRAHLDDLTGRREGLDRRIASVRTTLHRLQNGEPLMPDEMFDGFDHTRYRQEVEERWGQDAWRRSDTWWRDLDEHGKRAFGEEQVAIASGFAAALRDGLPPDGPTALALARRQYDWIATAWNGATVSADAFVALGDGYVSDPRFTAHYDAYQAGTAVYVRDAMRAFAERELRA